MRRARRLMRRAIAACAAIWLAGAAPAAFGQVRVTGDWVALKDVAPVSGPGGDVLIAPAPPPGETLALDPVFLVAVARKAGVVIALPMDEPVWVRRDPVRTAATPPAPPQARAAPQAVSVRQAPRAEIAPAATGSANALAAGEILVLAHDVSRGERITADALEWITPPEGFRMQRNALTSVEDIVGQEARRSLRAGSTLLANDIKAPDVVRKGEPVKLVYAASGLLLTVDAVAQASAAMGEPVRVFNQQSKRAVDAIASGEATASVTPRTTH
ncbi:flagellar basal body P-ring formation protein FlgA [bacterium]|nr:flagellar basal body P-ring formation protein FlgA [bacterium]